MYGDLQYTIGTHKWKGNGKVYKYSAHPKVWKSDFIVGFSGTANNVIMAHYYFSNPDEFRSPPAIKGELYGLVLTADREIYRFDRYTHWLRIHGEYASTGSGSDYALGAMATGVSPREAVKIAMKHDPFTGLGIKGHTFNTN
jgi:hypothetical protein